MDGYALIDIPRSGVENMALDQHLLETAAERQCVLLRLYRWSEPTLSLGYFQPYAQRLSHPDSSHIAVVRRATGGGAIVHHFDWTYCMAVPQALSVSGKAQSLGGAHNIGASQPLYDCVHDAVVQWLNELGITAQKWTRSCELDTAAAARERQAAFLCFERRSCGDVVWGAEKVMGSAQRRIPGAVLQHGSLLLARSPYAPSLPGLGGALDQAGSSQLEAHAPGAPEPRGAQPLRVAEGLLQRLMQAVEMTAGVKLAFIQSLAESPVHWTWPAETRFAKSSWTERL